MIDDTQTLARTNMLLVCLIEEVRGLARQLAGRSASAPQSLRPADTATLSSLLPPIAALMGPDSFTLRALLECARVDAKNARAVRDALAAAGIGENARQLGRLLRRAAVADVEVGGLYVDHVGSSRDGACWRVIAETRETRIASSFATALHANIQA